MKLSYKNFFLLISWAALPFRLAIADLPEQPVKILVLLPLSGGSADQGEWYRNGVDIAVGDINSRNEHKVDVVYEDTKGDPKLALEAYRAATAREKIGAVMSWGSGVANALTPVVNKDEMVLMGVAVNSMKFRTPDDFTFRNFYNAADEGVFVAHAVKNDLHAQTTILFSIQNDYGISLSDEFRSRYLELGGSIVVDDVFPPGQVDFRSQILRFKKFPNALIYIVSYPSEGAIILKQLRELRLANQILMSGAVVGGKRFFDLVGDSAEGTYIELSGISPENNSSESFQHFYKEYLNRFGNEETPFYVYAAYAYDGVRLLSEALAKCPQGPKTCVRDALYAVKDFDGASGRISFDRNGETACSLRLRVIRKRAFLPWPE